MSNSDVNSTPVAINNAQNPIYAGNVNLSDVIANGGGELHRMRPFIGEDGRTYVTSQVNRNPDGSPLYRNVAINNAATLRKDDWIKIDQAVVQAARPRLRFFNDLRANGLNVNMPNALGTTVWQYEQQSNITPATVSMDGLRKGEADRPEYKTAQMPLPLIHKDFAFPSRQIAVSRNHQQPLDVTTASAAARMVAETVEQLALGVYPDYKFGNGNVYGLCNYPDRLIKVFTNPWALNEDGKQVERNPFWTPGVMLKEILEARDALMRSFHYGPYAIYHSLDFEMLLDDDFNYAVNGFSNTMTMRERLLKIEQIQSIRSSEFLPPGTWVMVEMDANTIEAITGMDITTVQWQKEGGFEVQFKVLCILLPRIKSDFYRRCGILHAQLAPAQPLEGHEISSRAPVVITQKRNNN